MCKHLSETSDKRLGTTYYIGVFWVQVNHGNVNLSLTKCFSSMMTSSPLITANIGFLFHWSQTQGFLHGIHIWLASSTVGYLERGTIRVKELLAIPRLCQNNAPDHSSRLLELCSCRLKIRFFILDVHSAFWSCSYVQLLYSLVIK